MKPVENHFSSSLLIALYFTLFNTQALAQPQLSFANLNTLTKFCAGNNPVLPPSNGHNKIMFIDTDGSIPDFQDALPEEIRAENFSSIGVVVCLEELEVELETCTFGIFFNIPRVRRDYLLTAYSIENPGENVVQATINGGAPPACDDVEEIDNTVSSIEGDIPAVSAILAALDALQLNTLDTDNDGFSNIREFVLASDPADDSSPGPQISITVNGTTNLVLAEGEAFTINISLHPGQYLGETSDYFVYADTLAGMFSYIHPSGFESVQNKEVSATLPALHFSDFRLKTLPGLGVGDYELHFDVEIGNLVNISSSANISIIPNTWQFTEVSEQAGFNYSHGYANAEAYSDQALKIQIAAAGVAAGDYDNDGWVDLYITRGTIGPNLLFKNMGDGTFTEVGASAGVALNGRENSGVVFADYDGDGWLDLLVTGNNNIQAVQPTLFHNNGDGSFEDVTASSGLTEMLISVGGSYADIDKDGDLDLWISHWLWNRWQAYLWRNNGDGTFSDISKEAGIPDGLFADNATSFADINNDGWPDILIAGDYGTSQVLINNKNGTFTVTTTGVISDEYGMGAAVGDYDNDGDLDWFVSSIYSSTSQSNTAFWEATGNQLTSLENQSSASGNRFYQNQGDGTFIDVTDETGTRIGFWGWGSCFADFNNDAHLDLFHVNGWIFDGLEATRQFEKDPSRLFISDQNGAFLERSWELGLIDGGQGRGIVCFDYDRDGDVDIFIANSEQAPALFRNDGGNNNNYLHIQVAGEFKNTEAIGARVYVTTNELTQMRELQISNNYMSQNPVEVYFGLADMDTVDSVRVVWPSGQEITLENVSVNQLLFVPLP